MTVLSRKPMLAKRDPTNGDDGDDSEEEARKKKEADFEERKRRAAIEREEKVKKYAEARERIMGTSNSASGSRESSQGRDNRRTRGKASRPTSAGQSPARTVPVQNASTGGQQVFDPEDMGRRLVPRRETPSTPKEGEPARQPKGPDARGGFGFGRGGRTGP